MEAVTRQPLSRVGLVIVGDEILVGRRQDKHFQRALTFFGGLQVDISWVYFLGDDLEQLAGHFRAIGTRGEICFSFGGIGATPDDVTRQAVAAAFGLPVVRHPEARRLIEHRFGEEAYPNRIRMADLPEGAELIPNPHNDIPGFFLAEIYCLPGFPEMAWPMLEWVVGTRYSTEANPVRCLRSFTVTGARESEIIPIMETVQARVPEVRISSLPRFSARGDWRLELGVRGVAEQAETALSLLREAVRTAGFGIEPEGG